MEYRIEKDMLGEKKVPSNSYWGIHTQRALENFCLSSNKVDSSLIKAIAMVKKAAALSNLELGSLEEKKAQAILSACDELIDGKFQDQFPLDAMQGGAGTSTNMNANEVIANRAIELMGGVKGDYAVINPVEDVNLHQSTNDVYPTALKIACIFLLRDLSQTIAELQGAFQRKEKEFSSIVKLGRTELQDAVPMTLGQEFSAFAEATGRDRWRVFKCEERLRTLNIGATAIGTGLTAPRSYIFLVIEKLRQITGLGIARGENAVDQTANSDCFVEVSGILKANAANLIKISNDLRLLQLLGEIKLPAVQAGSSIMPGKVNPVILEAAMQAGYKVIANDLIVTESVYKGTLQINEFMPMLAFAMLESLQILKNANAMLKNHIEGIRADEGKCKENLDKSQTIITAFLSSIGYDKAGQLIKEFCASGKCNIREFLEEKLGKETVEKTLSAQNLTALGYRNETHK